MGSLKRAAKPLTSHHAGTGTSHVPAYGEAAMVCQVGDNDLSHLSRILNDNQTCKQRTIFSHSHMVNAKDDQRRTGDRCRLRDEAAAEALLRDLGAEVLVQGRTALALLRGPASIDGDCRACQVVGDGVAQPKR